jgi:chromosome partitioning protein
VQESKLDHHRALTVEGIIVNQFQARASLPRRIVEELMAERLPVLIPYLSASVRIRESHQHSRPVIYLDPRHKVTGEYVALHDASG